MACGNGLWPQRTNSQAKTHNINRPSHHRHQLARHSPATTIETMAKTYVPAMVSGMHRDVSRLLHIMLLRFLLFFPGVRRAILAAIQRHIAARRVQSTQASSPQASSPQANFAQANSHQANSHQANFVQASSHRAPHPSCPPPPPPPSPPPLPIFATPQVGQTSSLDEFVSVHTISSTSASDVSSLYYDLSSTSSASTSVSEELRALYAMSYVQGSGQDSRRVLSKTLDPIFFAQEHRIITPRPTPPPSPAIELNLSLPSTPSTGSYAPSSWVSDRSSYRERVAVKLAAKRKELERSADYKGPRLLFNGKDAYAVAGRMGSGAHGRVMYAKNRDAQELAIKVIHKAKAYRFSSGRENILNELKALKRVTQNDLPFVCPLLASWSDVDNIYLVMPCLRENLLQRIDREPLSEKEVLIYSAELMSAIANIHSCGVIHRDIKPENVLFDANGHIVLADFGLSHTTSSPEISVKHISLRDVVGTPGYWAPEVICVTGRHGYGWEIDIWSIGLVIFDMAENRTTPFYDAHRSEEVRRQMMLYEVPIWNIEDDLLRDLLSQMIIRNPRCRWSAQNLRDHEYFHQVDWEAIETKDYRVNLPPLPKVDDARRSLTFSTFHQGKDEDCPDLVVTSKGEVVPNRNVRYQLDDDRDDPSAFNFTMNAEYRRILLREFVCEDDIPFHSRYNPNPGPIPPPPAAFIRTVSIFDP